MGYEWVPLQTILYYHVASHHNHFTCWVLLVWATLLSFLLHSAYYKVSLKTELSLIKWKFFSAKYGDNKETVTKMAFSPQGLCQKS